MAEPEVDSDIEKVETPPMEDNKPVAINLRNFRTTPEIENFYRFINENSLRHETKILLKLVLNKLAPKRKKKKSL